MATVMRQWGSPLGTLPGDGQFLKEYDFEARDGRGEITLTPNIQDAKKFADIREALEFQRTSPKCRPRRADGRPNRPLTAANFEFVTVPD